ncbi:MAG TPA: hypothetical protein VFO79_12430 [Xanthomonadales bacterium]|nr:hypothetical protein [Xanthomonadales bacterium]
MNASNARWIAALLAALAAFTARAEPLPRFPAGAVWNQNVESAALHPDSASMISTLQGLGGFGNGRFQIDFSFRVVRSPGGAPTVTLAELPSIDPADGYYLPDCDALGTEVPLPAGATIEGETGMTCTDGPDENLIGDGDCHYLVVEGNLLHEVYRANLSGGELQSQCLATWRLDVVYPPEGRGDHCTSADAAGFPIAPLLFNADEIAASLAQDATGGGDIGHAIRFILPNGRIARDTSLQGSVGGRLYVRPATHAGGPTGPVGTVPYGARLRLRADFPLDGYNPAARVLLNTLKRYGMVLSDGGNIALTGESDLYTTAKWADLGLGTRVFDQTPGATDVFASDFQVLDTGPRIAETYDCVRTEVALDVLFSDGFE